jgi:hypothetical protein
MLMRSLWLVIAVLVLVAGCGKSEPTTTSLVGQITVDGKLILDGRINFVPLDANRGRGATAAIARGRYMAPDVPLGRVRVYFNATKATGRTVIVSDLPMPEVISLIPEKYRVGMEIEVKRGQDRQDFNLDSH